MDSQQWSAPPPSRRQLLPLDHTGHDFNVEDSIVPMPRFYTKTSATHLYP
jgi:hypothetical protein